MYYKETGMCRKIKEALLFTQTMKDEDGKIKAQIMEDNRRSVIVWSAILIVFCIYYLIFSKYGLEYERCEIIYYVELALSITTLLAAAFLVRKAWQTRILMYVIRASLLGVGIAMCLFMPEVRTATYIAAVLIAPVMFIDDTMPSIILAAIAISVYVLLSSNNQNSDVYTWTLKNLLVYSAGGIISSHFINRSRLERYVFAASAVKLAELQKRYAYYDQMTGLQNRRAYNEKLEQLKEKMPDSLCVIMADINGLKEANDTLGHEAGDELITGSARCLSESFAMTDMIYRLGGDEFAVIVEGNEEDVLRSLDKLSGLSRKWKGRFVDGISISCGYATNKEYSDLDLIITTADQRMYESKSRYYLETGKDRRTR